MPYAPESLVGIAERVERRLQALVEIEQARWADLDPDLGAPMAALGRLLSSGGKRLRPAFCYWGFVGAGGDVDDERSIDAGAAFELLHAFALLHDDVMDGSATRRGLQTTHVSFSDEPSITSSWSNAKAWSNSNAAPASIERSSSTSPPAPTKPQ